MTRFKPLAWVLAVITLSVSVLAQTFSITQLGLPNSSEDVATGINSSGQVCGYSIGGKNEERAWRYTPGQGVVDLGTLGGHQSRALGINDLGQVTGYSTDANGKVHGFVAAANALVEIPEPMPVAGLFPQQINQFGRVVGYFTVTNGEDQAFSFSPPNGFTNLGIIASAPLPASTAAYGVNEFGSIVGIGTGTKGFNRAFRTSINGEIQELGTLGGDESWAYAVNRSNQIVGSASFLSTDSHAFLFSEALGMVDLGTLGGYTSAAFGINQQGDVVGYAENPDRSSHAAFWATGGRVLDLNERIPVDSGWVLTEARAINATGSIVGNGLLNGRPSCFLISPVSGPDLLPPVAVLRGNSITNLQSSTQFLRITFWDDTAVQASSITTNCIRVLGPNGFDQLATLYPYAIDPPYQATSTNDAIAIVANFYVTPPNGVWSGADNGEYQVSIVSDTVRDTNGNGMPGGVIGVFHVATETRPVVSLNTVSTPVMNQPATFTITGKSSFPYTTNDVFQWTVDWDNDGSDVQSWTGIAGSGISHTFASIGVHTARVVATDVHGVQSFEAFTSVLVVNPPSPNAWAPAPSLTGNRRQAIGLNAGGTLVCLGGLPLKSSKLQAQLLVPGAGAFVDGARISAQTLGLGAGVDALNRIVLFGGIEPNSSSDNLGGYVYQPAVGKGPAIASKRIAAHDFAFCSDDRHRLYSIGGTTSSGATDGVERYDAIANAWTTLPPLPAKRSSATATYDGKGHILAIGGWDPELSAVSSSVFSYDIGTDHWIRLGDAPFGTFGPVLGRVAQLGADGLVYWMGGWSGGQSAANDVFAFDPVQQRWIEGPRLTVGRGAPAVALGDDGFIYAMGGDESSGGGGGGGNNGQATVERLDTVSLHAPRIVSNVSIGSLQAGNSFSDQILATGNPRPTYSLTKAPVGMLMDPNSGVVTWATASNQVGRHTVIVRAASAAGQAEQVFTINVTPIPGDVTHPATPENLSLVFRSTAGVTLTWSPATDNVGVTSYNIYGLFRGSRSSHIGLMASGITGRSYITHGFATSYYIAAVDAAGNVSPRSLPVSNGLLTLPVINGPLSAPSIIQGNAFLTTISCTANPSAGFSALSGPEGMTFTHIQGALTNADYVVVQWQPSAAQVGTNVFTVTATNLNTTGSSKSFSLVVLPNGTDFIPPTPVAQMTASAISFDQCTLEWTPAGDNIGIAKYHLVATHFGAASNHVVELDVPGSTTQAVLSGLLPGSGYTVVITPSDAALLAGSPTSIFLTTLARPEVVMHLVGGLEPGSLTLLWNSPTGAWKFTVESADSLLAPNWLPLEPVEQWPTTATNVVVSSELGSRFFRVRASH